jgi:hypothetical protein
MLMSSRVYIWTDHVAWDQYVHIYQVKYSEKKTEKSPEMPGQEVDTYLVYRT